MRLPAQSSQQPVPLQADCPHPPPATKPDQGAFAPVETPRGQCRLTTNKGFLSWTSAVTSRTPPDLLWLHGIHIYMDREYETGLIIWQPPEDTSWLWLTNSTVQGGLLGLWTTAPVLVSGARLAV